MRKMKKINGYLVVKFNARELREYEGTALGEYGVIDAELYTGNLDVDRGAMEYDNAGSMEEAVELARGLESELDAEEPEVKVTIVKETDETTEEEEVDAQQMIAGWENVLRGQVASAHYKDVDERTAAHELYGYLEGFEVDPDAMVELKARACNMQTGCFRLLDRTLSNVTRILEERGERVVTVKIIEQASSLMML